MLTDACVDQDVLDSGLAPVRADLMAGCPGANFGRVTVDPSGTFVFSSDTSYSATLGFTISIDMVVPDSCIAPRSCADLEVALQANMDSDPNSFFQTVSCMQTAACSCRLSGSPPVENETGTYTTTGTALMLTSATGTETIEYCVQGTTLLLQLPVVDPTQSFIRALVAQKQ